MNESHRTFLASDDWRRLLEQDLLPWIRSVGGLGDDVLEIGPGPGLTTDLLRAEAAHVTAVEIDPTLADPLRARLDGTNVDVRCADATEADLGAGRFSTAACFSMLHHMPSPEHQDRLFAAVHGALRPGGAFVGVDALDLPMLRDAHADDTFVPVDPATLPDRLRAAGFEDTSVDVQEYQFRFVALRRQGSRDVLPHAPHRAPGPGGGRRSARRR